MSVWRHLSGTFKSVPLSRGGIPTCSFPWEIQLLVCQWVSHVWLSIEPDFLKSRIIWAVNLCNGLCFSYKCVCVPGITGENCEINVNECDPEPCVHGSCKDVIGNYECECEDGFEGTQCEIEIDECERYTPCIHGTCSDRRANYYCDCEPKYGGKNCSVELTGCLDGPCLNNGTCRPYLENETNQKYNCSCPNGFHGQNCTEVCKWVVVVSTVYFGYHKNIHV